MKTRYKILTFVVLGITFVSSAFGAAYLIPGFNTDAPLRFVQDYGPELLEAQESMRAAFHANVDVEGYPIKQIVIGHGIGDDKYIIDVNADFFNSKYWPSIQENITSILGDKVEIEYKEGEPLDICGEGTILKDGACMVINGKSPSDEEVFSFQVFLFSIFSSIVGLPVFGVVYWWKRKKQRTVVLPVLILISVLLLLGFFFGAIPNAIA